MRNNNVLALIFANRHDEALRDMTAVRAMGSLPVGGRYRLIDFTLSGLVNAGVSRVGIVTKSHYQSLFDHIGSGKAWDLSRKHAGLTFLPSSDPRKEAYDGRIAVLSEIDSFLRHAQEEYVILSDCHLLGNIDYDRLIDEHLESRAEISLAYKRGPFPALPGTLALTMDPSGRVTDLRVTGGEPADGCYGLGIVILRRDRLCQLVADAAGHNRLDFERDILQKQVDTMPIHGIAITEYVEPVCSLARYFAVNMDFLNADIRAALFPAGRPVYTKVRDCAPAKYGLHADAADSLVADGARIEGTVRRSIVFRNVVIEKGAVVENCIVMQGAHIGAGAVLRGAVLDKNVTIKDGVVLQGAADYPMFVAKGAVV
ncbi:MAG: glucose-1-phosphate adenylyltransferase subunit GlgD [Acutalibacteraceae bacterium]|jgi:glucose-1-phosphate adenylyltransferase